MYSVFLIAVVGFAFGALLCLQFKPRINAIGNVFVVFVCTFLGAVIGTLLAAFLANFVSYHNAVYENGALVAMRNTQGLQGTFVIGTFGLSGHGELKSTQQYNFLLRVEDGSMVPHSMIADTLVHLVEDESLKDVGYWTTTYYEPNPDSALFNWAMHDASDRSVVRQEFRVPAGTVVQNFEIH
jgi:hypothetical protein